MKVRNYRVELTNEELPKLVRESTKEYKGSDTLSRPSNVADMLNRCYRLSRQAEEHVYLICLDNRLAVIGTFEISHGTVNASLMSVKDIMKRALLCGATNIMVAHNHPSGNMAPSKEDISVTKKLKKVCDLMEITLLDHIIIGWNTEGYTSLRNEGIIE